MNTRITLLALAAVAALLGGSGAAGERAPSAPAAVYEQAENEQTMSLALAPELFTASQESAVRLPGASDCDYLLMQFGNSLAVRNGESINMLSAAGSALAPVYDGAVMLPLRGIADAYGLTIEWDGENRKTLVTCGDTVCSLGIGQTAVQIGAEVYEAAAPVTLYDGSAFVSADAVCRMLGVYSFVSTSAEGDFILLTDIEIYSDSGGYLIDLASFREIGLELIGPSCGMLDQAAVYMKCGSPYAVIGGSRGELTADPLVSGGFVLVPLEDTLSALGCEAVVGSSGVYEKDGREASFPLGTGSIIIGGEVKESAYYTVCERNGTIFASANAIADAFGLELYMFSDVRGIVFCELELASYDALREHAHKTCALLPTVNLNAAGYIALTFDDGPSGTITHRLLDGLAERGAHATFFLCNYRIASYESCMVRYEAEGHQMANHSASHTNLAGLSDASMASEIDNTNSSISAFGTQPTLMRPPGGGCGDRLLSALSERGMSCMLWNIDPQDWKTFNSETVAQRILSKVGDGDVVLLHDLYSTSVDAALKVIDVLQAQGYEFVTIAELAEVKGIELEAGQAYYSF